MNRLLLVILLGSFSWVASAQNSQTAPLKQALTQTTTDTSRILLLADISASYRYSRLDSAVQYAREGETAAKIIRYAKGEGRCLTQLGFVLSEKGDLAGALAVLLHAQGLNELANDQRGLAQTLQVIGYLFVSFPDYKQAKEYLYRAQKRYNKLPKEDPDALLNLANLGYVYRYENKPDSARYYQQLAYQMAIRLPVAGRSAWGDPLPFILRELGAIDAKAGAVKQGLVFLRQAKTAAFADNNRQVYTRTCNTMATLFQQQNQPDSALYYARQALLTSEQTGLTIGVLKNSQLVASLFKARRQADSALKYTELMMNANDSLYNQQRIKQLESINFEEQKHRRRLEEQKARFEGQVTQYALLSGAFVLLIISVLLWRNNRHQRRANVLLTDLNEQVHRQKTEITQQRDDLSHTLTDLRTTQTQLIQAEKMASLGELTAGIAHEIQNPLNFVNNFSDVSVELLAELQNGPFRKLPDTEKEYAEEIMTDLTQNLQKISLHGSRASSIVKGMLQHSRASTGQRELTDINALCDEYLRLAYHGLRAKDKTFNASFKTDFDASLGQISVIPQDMGRVLLNLFTNAFYAVRQRQQAPQPPKGEPYQPSVSVTTRCTNGQAVITVSDNGTGIPESVRQKIFQPFFTTKPTGEGTGLGLSMAFDIVTKGHTGTIEMDSTEGEGTTFTITLPA